MTDPQSKIGTRRTIVSAVETDGTLIETVFRKATGDTTLVMAREGEIETKLEWQRGVETFVPIRATNNLIRQDRRGRSNSSSTPSQRESDFFATDRHSVMF